MSLFLRDTWLFFFEDRDAVDWGGEQGLRTTFFESGAIKWPTVLLFDDISSLNGVFTNDFCHLASVFRRKSDA